MEILERTVQEIGAYLPRIIAAIVVLILGWLISWLLAGLVLKCLRRVNLNEHVNKGTGGKYDAGKMISGAVFWIGILLTVIAFFSVLQLPPVADSLRGVLDQILGYLPRLLAAAILFAVAWILATMLKFAVSKAVSKSRLDEKVSKHAGTEEAKAERVPFSKTLGNAAYWLVFLLFLPAILGALEMEGILAPVEQMVEKIVAFLPNLFIAAFILFVGWFLAKIVKQIITNVLAAVGTDRLGDRIGLNRVLGTVSLSQIIGTVIYILILIPIIIAALDAVRLDQVTEPASVMLERILAALPLIFSAILILAIAYVVGKLVSRLVVNLLESMNFDSLPYRLGLGREVVEPEQTSTAIQYRWSPSMIVGYIILALIMLFAAISAFNILGFEYVAVLISQFMLFVGDIIVGLIIFALGLYIANIVARIIRSRDVAQANILAIVAKAAILLLAGAMALRQMGLANEIISLAFGLLLGSAAVAAAIAFGIGGRDIAGRKLDQWTRKLESKEQKPKKEI